MDHHMDIRILRDPEFSAPQLMNALYSKLHRVLVHLSSTQIGVSFPEVEQDAPHLGNVLRIHAQRPEFDRLMNEQWLTGMRDHIQIGEIAKVPNNATACRVRRIQAKSNPERIRRRQMRRHGWSQEEARQRIPDDMGKTLSLPFLSLVSGSTGHRFRLFLRHEPSDVRSVGAFNTYGLSSTATVPWF